MEKKYTGLLLEDQGTLVFLGCKVSLVGPRLEHDKDEDLCYNVSFPEEAKFLCEVSYDSSTNPFMIAPFAPKVGRGWVSFFIVDEFTGVILFTDSTWYTTRVVYRGSAGYVRRRALEMEAVEFPGPVVLAFTPPGWGPMALRFPTGKRAARWLRTPKGEVLSETLEMELHY